MTNRSTTNDRMTGGNASRLIVDNVANTDLANGHTGTPDQKDKESKSQSRLEEEPIAIVGMAGRFPGDAVDVKGLWDMCCEGRSAWSKLPENRMDGHTFFHPDFSKHGTVGSTKIRQFNASN